MEKRVYTIDEVCKILKLIWELKCDVSDNMSHFKSYFKMYLKWLCQTFDKKVDIQDITLMKNAIINAKLRTSPNCILTKLEKEHELQVLFKFRFDRWMSYNLNNFNTITRDGKKVKLVEVLKENKIDYPVVGIIEGETDKKYWSRTGEFKIGEESNQDIFYIDTLFDEHLKCYKEDIIKIL